MIFETLKMENIRSYQSNKVNFPLGTSLFEGDVGSGKSTILMALEFALFGLGNQKGDALLRKGSKKGSVLLNFSVENNHYQIKRTLVRNENNNTIRQDKVYLGINNKKIHLSPSEIKERILDILNFKESPNPRAQSVIFRYAVYTPQEEMKFILSQKPDLRLETLRKAFGIEDYKIAAENATSISRIIKDKISFLSGQISDLDEKYEYLSNLKDKLAYNESELKKFLIIKEKTENTLLKKREELDELKKSESELKEIKAEIPHLEKQINDKEDLCSRYKREINVAEEENRLKFIPEIYELEKLEKPSRDNEDNLSGKIDYVKKIIKERSVLTLNLSLLNETKEDIEIKLNGGKNKTPDQFQSEKKALNEKIEKQNALIKSHQDQLQKISTRMYQLEAKKGEINKKLQNLGGLGDSCPICGSLLDDNHKKNLKSEREKEFKKLNSETTVLKEVKIKAEKELESNNMEFKQLEDNFRVLESKLDKMNELIKLNDKIKSIEFNLSNIDENLALVIEENIDFEDVDHYLKYLENLLDKLKEFNRAQEHLKNLKYQFEKNNRQINENTDAISNLKQEIKVLKESSRVAQEKVAQIAGILEKIEKLNQEHENASEELQGINEKTISTKTLMESMSTDITKVENDIKKMEILRKNLDVLKDYHTWLNEYLIPTLSLIEKHVMQNIHLEFNDNFQKWFNLLMDDPSKTGKINEEFTPIVEQDGFEQEVNFLSGGEKTSVALAYRLALNNMVQKVSTGMKSNLLILDEPTDGFSKEQLFKVREILNELDCPQIIIVSHEKELESFADHVFQIEKIDGVSEVLKVS